MNKRKQYSAGFKSKVALEAIRGDLTLSQLSAKYGVHGTQIANWKRQALSGMESVFSGKVVSSDKQQEQTVKELHAKIGQLLVEKDFLLKASGH